VEEGTCCWGLGGGACCCGCCCNDEEGEGDSLSAGPSELGPGTW
jgi:hypothetical protein